MKVIPSGNGLIIELAKSSQWFACRKALPGIFSEIAIQFFFGVPICPQNPNGIEEFPVTQPIDGADGAVEVLSGLLRCENATYDCRCFC